MSSSIDYFVNGKPYSTTKPELTLADLLNDAGFSADRVFLESSDGRIYEDPGELVQIHSGEQFLTKKRERPTPTATVIHYEVNGEPQSTDRHELTLQAILGNAGSDATIDVTQLNSYFLENLADGSKYENLLDIVTVNEGDKFLAVYVGSTPVA